MKIMAAILVSLFALGVSAEAVPGQVAPPFSTADARGKTISLADYKGKWIVMEWFNRDCPYVKKHYGSHNMQKLQSRYTANNVVWLTVLSSAPGKEGYSTATRALADAKGFDAHPTDILLDPSGTLGKAYGAKTTPHMFVINPAGQVAYAGAIDDNDSSDPAVISTSHNYVEEVLDAGLAGNKIIHTSSRPYGCSVKYQ